VATVQREQDEIIRAPLPGVLVVQGGPGTGKTAVVLHRAAYLLYTYRFPLERQGVLVVGPNPLFLRYIEQVLPSLGESGAELSTISGLLDVPVRGSDEPAAGRLKGDRRMVTFLRRAVGDRQRPLSRDLEVGWGAYTLGLPVAASAGMVSSLKRRSGTHNARRRQLEAMVFRHLFGEHQAAERRLHRTGLRPPSDDGAGAPEAGAREELTLAELTSSLRRNETVVAALDRMWPLLTPEELLHDLFGAPALVKLAGRGVLSPPDQQLLHRSRSLSLDVVPWTDDDIPLLDEALVILGPRRRLSPDDSAMRTYGHIAVDEAQDLSPMQLRMVGRRSLSGSMTVVGDVAQATGHWAPSSWDDVLAHLPTRRGSQVSELTVNYRTPSEVMDLASLVLAQVAPGVRPPTSVRSSGSRPTIVHAAGPDLGSVLGQMVQSELDAVEGGTVAVICARSSTSTVVSRLRAVGVVPGDAGRTGLEAPVTVIPVELVKGLEFDSVIVVEPARLVREADQGLRALYVALTRATRRLSLLHSEPLPPVLV
jgi:DNA helicase IV